MGYNLRKGLVEENVKILEHIHRACVQTRAGLTYRVTDMSEMNSLWWRFSRLLKAAQVLTDEADGRFADLRERVEIRKDWRNRCLTIQPKAGAIPLTGLQPVTPDENEVIRAARNSTAPFLMQEFVPSTHFNWATFEQQLNVIGWTCISEGRPEEGGGEPTTLENPSPAYEGSVYVGIHPMRQEVESRGAFDLLDRLGGDA